MFSRRVPFGCGFCEFCFGLVKHYRDEESSRANQAGNTRLHEDNANEISDARD
ncbi:hypothetical protein ACE6H2_005818 [Prunus campanulata]